MAHRGIGRVVEHAIGGGLPPRRTRRLLGWGWRRTLSAIGIGLALVAVVIGFFLVNGQFRVRERPQPGDAFAVLSDTTAAEKAEELASTSQEGQAAAALAERPTAYWLTPERNPIDSVRGTVTGLLSEARAQQATLVLVVYGVPGRDCGGYSSGGIDSAAYAEWTRLIGDAIKAAADVSVVLVLEPDSLALTTSCGNLDTRVVDLRVAIGNLDTTNDWIYVDGGHSNWNSAEQTAGLIEALGDLSAVHGFFTNVSNFNSLQREVAYADAVSAALGGMHAIIDTSRSGTGTTNDWCNPSGILVGEDPGTFGDDVVDVNLWIKPPGESDGTCNGGPTAGTWWAKAAIEATRAVR